MRKYFILSLLLLCLLICGCGSSADKQEEIDASSFSDLAELLRIVHAYESYISENNKKPDSIEDVKTFCETHPDLQCEDIDWERFTLQKSEQGEIEILYKRSDVSVPFTVETEPQLTDTSEDIEKLTEKLVRTVQVKSDTELDEISKIVQCLHDFVRDNKQDQRFKFYEIKLNEDLITVSHFQKEREDLWYVNGWKINKYNYPTHPPRIIDVNEVDWPEIKKGRLIDARDDPLFGGEWTGGPRWYILASMSEGLPANLCAKIVVRIEKSDENSFEVTKWDVIAFHIIETKPIFE